ncbi:hypothetical protein EXN66_Car015748 [Channa argus]|uniref:Uncharacterized protein n=1 Tax=Channa argus TaxID=215402 RepID=A0A6G1QBN6_CHAAH|nr:hypothetical protein EXN66_Car015748 [Channa argus]
MLLNAIVQSGTSYPYETGAHKMEEWTAISVLWWKGERSECKEKLEGGLCSNKLSNLIDLRGAVGDTAQSPELRASVSQAVTGASFQCLLLLITNSAVLETLCRDPHQGLEVMAVRKQIDFSPPTHKQLTTQCSIRHTLETLSDKPLP